MSAESQYLEHLATIERIAAFVGRKGHLRPDENEDFGQIVCLRLIEDDYAIIRKFEGRSSFSTYLTTVIIRLFHQWRVEQWGKWRPSAEARRLGSKAVHLERLLTRDGFTFSEAVNMLTTSSQADCTVAELEALYLRLPLRNPRPVLVSEGLVPDEVAVDAEAEQRVEWRDRERAARKAEEIIEGVFRRFGAEDRLILQMRFLDACKVPEIARALHLDQKKLYKRLDKLLAVLRRALEEAGVHRADVDRLLGPGDQEIRLDLLHSGEKRSLSPSNPTGEEVRGGEGRLP